MVMVNVFSMFNSTKGFLQLDLAHRLVLLLQANSIQNMQVAIARIRNRLRALCNRLTAVRQPLAKQ